MTAPNLFILVRRLRHSLTRSHSSREREVPPGDIASLRRSLARLYKQNRHLKTQLSDLGIKRIADSNNQFDADSYRKALELNVKQEMYDRLFKYLSFLALLGSFGLFVALENVVQKSVEESVEAEVNDSSLITQIRTELDQQLERSQSDMLLSLMQSAIGPLGEQGIQDPLAVERIKNNKENVDGYIHQMQSLIQESDGQERELAIRYAAQTQDSDLRETLLTELRESTDSEIRLRMLEALMQYPEADLVEPLEVVKQEGEKSQGDFWQSAIHYLSTLRIKSNTPILRDVMNHALQSEDLHIVRSALVFFTLNPDTWNTDVDGHVKQISPQILPAEQLSPLKSLIQISESPDPSLQEQTESAQILASLNANEAPNNEDNPEETERWQKQLQEMQRHFAQKSLHLGNPKPLLDLRSVGRQYYSYSDWKNDILTLFPGFRKRNASEIDAARTQEEQHKLQDRLIDTIENNELEALVWNESGVYESLNLKSLPNLERASLERLRLGDVSLLNRYFENSGKYPQSSWSEIVAFFPDASPEQKQSQEAFQGWLESNSSLLWWDLSTEKYRLVTADGSIAQLNQGGLNQFLSWMSSTYYEEQVWREQVLPLFPDASETLFNAASPTGNYEEQDKLWRWVEENQVSFQWQADRKQYELSDR